MHDRGARVPGIAFTVLVRRRRFNDQREIAGLPTSVSQGYPGLPGGSMKEVRGPRVLSRNK
eukprot:8077791-Lingulodinium_polyedra.AAC.1